MCLQTLDGTDIFVNNSASYHSHKLPILYGNIQNWILSICINSISPKILTWVKVTLTWVNPKIVFQFFLDHSLRLQKKNNKHVTALRGCPLQKNRE